MVLRRQQITNTPSPHTLPHNTVLLVLLAVVRAARDRVLRPAAAAAHLLHAPRRVQQRPPRRLDGRGAHFHLRSGLAAVQCHFGALGPRRLGERGSRGVELLRWRRACGSCGGLLVGASGGLDYYCSFVAN